MIRSPLALLAALSVSAPLMAAEAMMSLQAATPDGPGAPLGSLRMIDTPYGLAFYPALDGLVPGVHGFHLHEKPSCEATEQNGVKVPAGAAGGHFDPAGTRKHGEPWGDGHLGDLPPLYVGADGHATQPVLAPRLKLSDLRGHALMVHAGGDNHSDHPAALGGGGARVACGVIPG